MNLSRILVLAASLSLTHSFIASAAERPKVKDVTGLAELHLEADEYYFEPAFLQGTPGQKLKLEVENESSTLHSFTIPEQKLDMDIRPEGKEVVEELLSPFVIDRLLCMYLMYVVLVVTMLTGDAR